MARHPDAPAILAVFEDLYATDRDEGREVSREEYAAMFPGFEPLIGKHYDRLESARSASSVHRSHSSAIDEFVELYRRDVEGGRTQSLAAYVARFPEQEGAVAQKFAELESAASPSRVSAVPLAAELPERIREYRLIRRLGRGGQGIVFLAEDEKLGHRVALKILKAGCEEPEHVVERFEREAGIVGRLHHRNICTVHGSGVEGGLAFIAFGYVPGETLARRLSTARKEGKRRCTIEQVLDCLVQIADALHAAHEVGIVHRDVKPGNVILREDGTPVILDFGLAYDDESAEGSLTRTGDLFGTPAYMSPEQIDPSYRANGARRVDARSDVYSLGAVAFEMLGLRRPFEAATRPALYDSILHKRPADLRKLAPDVPLDLATVVETALQKTPDRRYRSARDFAEDLRRVCEGQPTRATPLSFSFRIRQWAKRRPVIAALLVLAALGTLVNTALSVAIDRYRRQTDAALARQTRTREELAATRQRFEAELVASYRRDLRVQEGKLQPSDGSLAALADFDEWLRRARFVLAARSSPELAQRVERVQRLRTFVARAHIRTLTIGAERQHLRFGDSLCNAGDVDGDGFPDLVVGVPYDEHGALRSGSARLFSGRDGERLRTWSSDVVTAMLGTSVERLGDIDGDGRSEVAIGASCNAWSRPIVQGRRPQPGFVLVVCGTTGARKYVVHGEHRQDGFGGKLVSLGDVTGDGVGDLCVGARAHHKPVMADFVRLVSGVDGRTVWTYRLRAPTRRLRSMARLGDVDRDGRNDVAIGVVGGRDSEAGAIVVLSGEDGRLVQRFSDLAKHVEVAELAIAEGETDLLVSESFGPRDRDDRGSLRRIAVTAREDVWTIRQEPGSRPFGAVCTIGDVDGDGVPDLAVGSAACRLAERPTFARVVSGRDGATIFEWTGPPGSGKPIFVAAAGDVDRDGRPDLAVAVPTENYVLLLRIPQGGR